MCTFSIFPHVFDCCATALTTVTTKTKFFLDEATPALSFCPTYTTVPHKLFNPFWALFVHHKRFDENCRVIFNVRLWVSCGKSCWGSDHPLEHRCATRWGSVSTLYRVPAPCVCMVLVLMHVARGFKALTGRTEWKQRYSFEAALHYYCLHVCT